MEKSPAEARIGRATFSVCGLKTKCLTVSVWPYIVLITYPVLGSQMHICVYNERQSNIGLYGADSSYSQNNYG